MGMLPINLSKGAKRASDSIVHMATPAFRAFRLQDQHREKNRPRSDPGISARQSRLAVTRKTMDKLDAILLAKSTAQSQIYSASEDEFVGPLAQLYPDGRIIKPLRFCEKLWQNSMRRNGQWPSHDAEKSGETLLDSRILLFFL
jgi:hypothetical protein